MIEENNQGNPETMPAQEAAESQVFGSSGDDFFDALEDDVNSMVQDDIKPVTETEATPEIQGSNNVEEEANSVSQQSENENFKKRYTNHQALGCLKCGNLLKCNVNGMNYFIKRF